MSVVEIEQQIRDATRELTKLDMQVADDRHAYFVVEQQLQDWRRLLARRHGVGRIGRPKKNEEGASV